MPIKKLGENMNLMKFFCKQFLIYWKIRNEQCEILYSSINSTEDKQIYKAPVNIFR